LAAFGSRNQTQMKSIVPDRFEAEVLREKGPVIVLFTAGWCPFCRQFESVMIRQESDFPWPVVAVKIDDTSGSLWDRYSVDVIPTLAVFESGQLVFRVNGVLGTGLGEDDIERLREYIRKRSTKG